MRSSENEVFHHQILDQEEIYQQHCHNPIFEQIIKKLNIVANRVKTTKFEVWGCNLRVNWSILKELKVKDLIKS